MSTSPQRVERHSGGPTADDPPLPTPGEPARSTLTAAPQPAPPRSAPRAPSWQQGAAVALAMLSLLMVIFVGIVTIFSESPASLYAIDVVIVLGVVALSGVLFVLLGRAART